MTTTDAELRAAPLAILINRRCGHIAGTCNVIDPRMVHKLEDYLMAIRALGHRGWRIEIRPATDAELTGLATGRRCHRCRLD